MAGAGYKLFNTGDVLTAAQVNTYLMEQTVMRFATTTARDTALTGVLAEGMICYIDADNGLYKYTGSAWVNIDSGSTSPLTTKGDLYTYSTADARLPVGNNGETLVADSSQTTGLRYNPPVGSLANPIINGGMDIWQRGTSIAQTAGANYTADRWQQGGDSPSAVTVSRQTTSDTTNLPNIQYAARVQRNSGSTDTTGIGLCQSVESVNAIPYAGKVVTISFYARAGANFSAASSIFRTRLMTSTVTDQNILINGGTTVIDQNSTLTTTWQRFAYTGTIGATAVSFGTLFTFDPVGTAGANDWVEITGVQIDLGTYTASTAPAFRRSGGTLAGELAACQRYYVRFNDSTNSRANIGSAIPYSSTNALALVYLPVTMRVAPTAIEWANLETSDVWAANQTLTTVTLASTYASNKTLGLDVAFGGSYTNYRPYFLRQANSTAGYLGVIAEL